MKLNAIKNLQNMQKYFSEALGYRCYWTDSEKWFDNYRVVKGDYTLIMEIASIYDMIKYDECMSEEEKEQYLNRKIEIPQEIRCHYNPIFNSFSIGLVDLDDIDWSAPKNEIRLYETRIYAYAGLLNLHAFYYFAYCYARDDELFREIPMEKVKGIEDYLRVNNLEIYDCL